MVERRAYLTSKQVGDILGVSSKTASRWALEGRLPPETYTFTLGGHRRFNEQAIRQLLADNTEAATRGPTIQGREPNP